MTTRKIYSKDIEKNVLEEFNGLSGIYAIMLKPHLSNLLPYVEFIGQKDSNKKIIGTDEKNSRKYEVNIATINDFRFQSKLQDESFDIYEELIAELSEPIYVGMTENLKERIETHMRQFETIITKLSEIEDKDQLEGIDFTMNCSDDLEEINSKANTFSKRIALAFFNYFKNKIERPSETSFWFRLYPLNDKKRTEIMELENLLIKTIRPIGNFK